MFVHISFNRDVDGGAFQNQAVEETQTFIQDSINNSTYTFKRYFYILFHYLRQVINMGFYEQLEIKIIIYTKPQKRK